MIIAVCSSTPFSVPNAQKTFQSILKQTMLPDKIIWNYPSRSKRFNMDYPPIPSWASEFGIEVNICEDNGPSTKIIPVLPMANVSKIIIFDDDVYYDPRCIETLVNASRENESAALGFSGHTYKLLPFKYAKGGSWISSDRPSIHNEVAVLLCQRMVLYPRKAFPSAEGFMEKLEKYPMYITNDDHLYGALARQQKISLHVLHLKDDTTHDTICNVGRLTGTNDTMKCEFQMVCDGEMPFTFFIVDLLVIFLVILLIAGIFFAR